MTKRIPVPSEHDEQVVVVEWLEWQQIPFFAVPNGAKREVVRLKAEGLRAGVPDLILPVHRIAIEMKRRDASPSDTSPEQLEWLRVLKLANWDARVCRGAHEAIDYLRELGMERHKRHVERLSAETYSRTGDSAPGLALGWRPR